MILLIDNYDSFTFNLVHYLGELGAVCDVWRNDAISPEQALALKPEAIVLSPGPCTPNEAGICLDLIRAAAGRVPILGVCLGHQAIGQVFGGDVIRAPRPVHGKTSAIRHKGSDIFAGLPSPFNATRYHSLIVDDGSLPAALVATAHTDDRLIMGLAHRTLPIFGVQFHPESIASEHGHDILANFPRHRARRQCPEARCLNIMAPAPTLAAEASLKPVLARLATGATLDAAEAEAAFGIIMSGTATAAQIGGVLMAMRTRGETKAELLGATRAMRARMLSITAPDGAIDVCGTGGDQMGTLNVSTAVTFVVAGAGVPVAKHGNRAASSRAGGADVLAALGVRLDPPVARLPAILDEAGCAFLFAPRHHAALRHAAAARAELGIRTLFNLLGPLANPAGVQRQLTGVFDPAWALPVADTLAALGSSRSWVVHGMGLDELTIAGENHVVAQDGTSLRAFTLVPEALGLARAPVADIIGGDAAHNAAAMMALLKGTDQLRAYRDTVLLNAAAALVVAGLTNDVTAALEPARRSLESGAALAALDRLRAASEID